MSNVIPYFVLAVVALGFLPFCYAVFNRNDGESQAKDEHHDRSVTKFDGEHHKEKSPLMNLRLGDVTVTHEGGTNVYTASIWMTMKEYKASESMVIMKIHLIIDEMAINYMWKTPIQDIPLALGHHAGRLRLSQSQADLEEQEPVQDTTVSAESIFRSKNLVL